MSPPSKEIQNGSKIDLLGSWAGVIGSLLICLGILISALGYTGVEGQRYNLLNHFVSELGQIGVSDLAQAFNLSLIAAGVFNAVFLAWLPFQFKGWVRYPLLLIGILAAVSGALVGIFPMNALDKHIFVALAFFDLGLLTAFVYSLVILFSKGLSIARWLAIPGLFNTAAFLVFTNFPSQFEEGIDFQEGMGGLLSNRPDFIPLALMEWVVIIGVVAWFFTLGLYFLFRYRGKEENQSE
jgi:hypothetical membrane protein